MQALRAMKYILVTGGVISGVGKGVIASSLGTILKAGGIRVTSIKIDPYINIDAGTFSPFEHGEVYVLDDGAEVDLDLGNYERFLDITLHRDNNITTGKIYQHVIDKERHGDYLGKTVQVVPHITDAIQEWVEKVAKVPVDDTNEEPQCCIIELGGTIGDIEGMPFIEAFRQFQFRVQKENFACVHVSLIHQKHAAGEQKTKPTQNSVRELMRLGLSPDLVVCRSMTSMTQEVKQKVSMFCHVPTNQVICVPDCSSIYRVPLVLHEQHVASFFMKRLNIELGVHHKPKKFLVKWRELADRHDRLLKEVTVALVGKYTKLEDAYASVIKALQHAAMACNHRLNLKYIEATDLEKEVKENNPVRYHEAWTQLCSSNAIFIPGGFGNRGVEGKINAAEWARVNDKPMLGICLGLQCAVIEFARNVLGWKDAHSTEVDPDTTHPVITYMPEHHPGPMGGTMRLGQRRTMFKEYENYESVLQKLYGDVPFVDERHRHRYEVNNRQDYIKAFEEQGMRFVGQDVDGERMEIMELQGKKFYVAVQYHPEYLSRPLRPSAPYMGLILAATGKLEAFVQAGRESPEQPSDSDFSEDEDVVNALRISRISSSTSLRRNENSPPGSRGSLSKGDM